MPIWRPNNGTPLTPLRVPFSLMADSIENEISGITNNREIQTYKWANSTERSSATGTHGDMGTQLDNSTTWRHDGVSFKLVNARVYGRVNRSATATTFPNSYTNISGNTFWTPDVAQNIAPYNNGWVVPVSGQYLIELEVRATASFVSGVAIGDQPPAPATPTLYLIDTPSPVQSVAAATSMGTRYLAQGDVVRPYLLAASGTTTSWYPNAGSFGIRWVAP